MTRERRQPTPRELAKITSKRGAAVRRIPPEKPETKPQRPGPDTPDRGNHQEQGGGGAHA